MNTCEGLRYNRRDIIHPHNNYQKLDAPTEYTTVGYSSGEVQLSSFVLKGGGCIGSC